MAQKPPPLPPLAHDDVDTERRQFLVGTTAALGAVGAAACAVPFIASLNPSRDVAAQATVDIALADVPEGEARTFLWQGKPVFIWHRNAAQIAAAKAGDATSTMDPQPDAERVKKPEWLIVMGICTHLGCVPIRNDEVGGWRCPCHGSQFDASGRVIQGPAGTNLHIPPYAFLDDNTVRIG